MDTKERDDDTPATDEPSVALLNDYAAPEEEEEQSHHQGQPSPPGNILSAMLFWPVGKGLQNTHNNSHPMSLLSITNTVNSGETRKQGTTGGR